MKRWQLVRRRLDKLQKQSQSVRETPVVLYDSDGNYWQQVHGERRKVDMEAVASSPVTVILLPDNGRG